MSLWLKVEKQIYLGYMTITVISFQRHFPNTFIWSVLKVHYTNLRGDLSENCLLSTDEKIREQHSSQVDSETHADSVDPW